MEDVRAEVSDFLNKCEELKNCKFIMATTKIKDLLKSIVNSRSLYELFTAASENFDYLDAKSKCLIDVSDGISNRGVVVLPESVTDRLAFIFCLLVEFDRDSINFNWFIQKYFSDDGSFYGSFYAFCNCVIDSLEQMIGDIYVKELSSKSNEQVTENQHNNISDEIKTSGNSQLASLLSTISLLIARERQYIGESSLPEEDKEAGFRMLAEIFNALKSGNISVANAIVCGYNYYILYNNCISEDVTSLFENIEKYEGML